MAAREMVYDFKAVGAEETAARIRALNEEFKRGGIGLEEFGRKKRGLRSESRAYADTFRLETQLWINAHPNVQKLTQAVSVMSGVMHTALAIQNAMNLAMLVQQGQAAAMVEATAAVAQAQRELTIAQQSGDPIKIADAQEKLNIALARQAEESRNAAAAEQNRITTLILGIGSLVTTTIPAATAIAAHWGGVTALFARLPFLVGAGVPVLAALGVAASVAAGAIAGFFIADWLNQNTVWYHQYALGMTNLFHNIIPQLLAQGAEMFHKFFVVDLPNAAITMVNIMTKIVTAFVNMWIKSFNAIIMGLNRIPGVSIGLIPTWTAPEMPLISAAAGFQSPSLPQDTMFIAHKGEAVSITPAGQGAGGGTVIINNYIAGNVWTERELIGKIDEYRVRAIRDRL